MEALWRDHMCSSKASWSLKWPPKSFAYVNKGIIKGMNCPSFSDSPRKYHDNKCFQHTWPERIHKSSLWFSQHSFLLPWQSKEISGTCYPINVSSLTSLIMSQNHNLEQDCSWECISKANFNIQNNVSNYRWTCSMVIPLIKHSLCIHEDGGKEP